MIRINLRGVLISRHLSVKHFPSLRFHWRLFAAQKPPSGFCFHCRACCCICYVIIATSRKPDTVQLTNNCSVALINSGRLSHKGEEWPSSVGGPEGMEILPHSSVPPFIWPKGEIKRDHGGCRAYETVPTLYQRPSEHLEEQACSISTVRMRWQLLLVKKPDWRRRAVEPRAYPHCDL